MASNWKDILIERGFTYDAENEYFKKSLGFGRVVVVDQIVKGLFRITSGDKVLHDNFISSFDEFKKIIQEKLG